MLVYILSSAHASLFVVVSAAAAKSAHAPLSSISSHADICPRGAAPSADFASPKRASTLAAEVSLLDEARAALTNGAIDDALQLVGKYRRTFPRGELAADVEVISIDAFAAKNDAARAAADAERFLARYPNDPHAAHVRAVVDGQKKAAEVVRRAPR